jgi:hypothetical protein
MPAMLPKAVGCARFLRRRGIAGAPHRLRNMTGVGVCHVCRIGVCELVRDHAIAQIADIGGVPARASRAMLYLHTFAFTPPGYLYS